MTEITPDIEMELAALADGSLTPEQRERALERVRESPALQAALDEQRRAVSLTASVDVRAPVGLHNQVEAMLAAESDRAKRRRSAVRVPRFGLAVGATALAAAVVVVAIVLSGGGVSKLSVQQTAALALSSAMAPAPAESAGDRAQLAASVEGVWFPYWKERFGWRGSGTRSDRVAGRTVKTVFYTNIQGHRIGYAIVSGRAPATSGGTIDRRWGVSYRVLSHDGAMVVTWQRDGHLCVVAGKGVSAHTLIGLASWGSKQVQAT